MKLPKRLTVFAIVATSLLVCATVVMSLVVLADRALTSKILFELQEEKYDAVAATTADKIELYLRSVEETVRQNAMRVADDGRTPAEVKRLFERTLTVRSGLCGAMLAFAPGREPKGEDSFQALYARRGAVGTPVEFDANPVFDPKDDWFRLAFERKKPVWTEPYDDVNGGVRMITFACPILDANGEVEAVVTGDVSLDWIEKTLDALALGTAGKPVFITGERSVFFNDSGKWANGGRLDDWIREAKTPQKRREIEGLVELLRTKTAGEYHYRSTVANGESAWLYFRDVADDYWSGDAWTVGCVLSDGEVTGIVWRVVSRISAIGFLGLLALVVPSWFVARSVSRPLSGLAAAAGKIAAGKFDVALPPTRGSVELVALILAFKRMGVELRHYIKNVTEITKAKERVSSQLKIARSIQLGIVPKDFEPANEFGLDLCASMQAAQEVGGDLYDFAPLDERRFYFCVGDVSGKGIPASLFMAVGKTLLRAETFASRDVAKTMERANVELMKNNDAGLFITALGGFYDRSDNSVVFANAGHNPPILLAPGKRPELVDVPPGFPLALVDETEYETRRIVLPPGGRLLVYTDGVTDAVDVDGETFGTERLIDFLAELDDLSAKSIIDRLFAELTRYSSGAYQADDETALVFGPK